MKTLTFNTFVFITLIVFWVPVFGQQSITIEVSQVFSTFKFVDSQGKVDKSYANIISTASGIGYRIITKKNVIGRVNLGLRKGGAALNVDGDSYSWTLNYVDLKVGAGYILSKWKLKPYLIVSPYYAYLLKANQSINSKNYDLKNTNSFKGTDLGVVGTFGLKYNITYDFSIFGEFNYIYGIQNNEVSGNQKSFNRAYSFSLGIAIKTSKKSPKWLQEKTRKSL
jgi:hypothetical protein